MSVIGSAKSTGLGVECSTAEQTANTASSGWKFATYLVGKRFTRVERCQWRTIFQYTSADLTANRLRRITCNFRAGCLLWSQQWCGPSDAHISGQRSMEVASKTCKSPLPGCKPLRDRGRISPSSARLVVPESGLYRFCFQMRGNVNPGLAGCHSWRRSSFVMSQGCNPNTVYSIPADGRSVKCTFACAGRSIDVMCILLYLTKTNTTINGAPVLWSPTQIHTIWKSLVSSPNI